MGNNRFASVPNISIPRSRFKMPFNHSTSFLHGFLVPIDCMEVLPGDTFKLDLSSLIWMSNPIRPIFGNITAHVDAFFVPMRLVWDYTKEFFGENKISSGYQTANYKIPSLGLGHTNTMVIKNSLSHYLGKPITKTAQTDYDKCAKVSVLKERAYYEIWNNYYRAQQLQNPVIITYTGNGVYQSYLYGQAIGSWNGSQLKLDHYPMHVNKEFDYFTAATLYPQYGPAVSLPLGSFAPLVSGSTVYNIPNSKGRTLFSNVDGNGGTNESYLGNASYDVGTPLLADLSNATAATINSLRYAFAVQKFLERSNFGSRFFEMLQVHYGVTSPDATLQIPQRIGHADFAINVSTVLSTAGAQPDATTELGMPGAASCTGSKKYLFTHAFTEPGFLFVLLSTTHERSYTQGILREDSREERYEIYSPEFANLGDQEILKKEIFYSADPAYDEVVFGYQEHWAEYRYRPHRVSGELDPQANSTPSPWVLTDDYSAAPSLDGTWIMEDRDWVVNCLVSGNYGPDYIGDFYFDYTATREMPLFTIPGLIDHFGSY